MKQVGFRQEAARLGGIGSCGRELCCSTWLTDFRSVSTSSARFQQLSLNPQKLAGQCGKLKCCLRFEWDFYHESLKDFPSTGIPVETADGIGTIVSNDILNRRCTVYFEQAGTEVYDLKTIKKALKQMNPEYKERKS